jgi:hypothetical protein
VQFDVHAACQSFCLSVQTAAISGPAPSAAFSKESSLLNAVILHAQNATFSNLIAAVMRQRKKKPIG